MKVTRIVSGLTASALFLSTMGVPHTALAGGIPLGLPAQEPTQWLNEAHLAAQYAQQLQQYATQLQQWQTEYRNAVNLPQQAFGPIRQDLLGIQRAVQGGNAISYAMANLDSQFTSKYTPYGYQQPQTSFESRYANWSQTSLDSTQKALDAAGVQNSQMNTEQDLLTYLETASQSADGQLKAIQVGNQIAEQQVQQMLKLRQLMMADLQSKAAFQNNQIMQQNQAAQARNFFQTSGKFANGAGGSSSSSGGGGATPSAMAITPRN